MTAYEAWSRGELSTGSRVLALVAMTVALTFLVFSDSAPASSAPVIESLSASHVTESDATLEAQINPEDLETTYELWMEDPCKSPMQCIRVPRLLTGSIPAGASSESLSIDLASSDDYLNIEPGMTYGYWVIAKNSDGTVEEQKTFKTLSGQAPVIESVSVTHPTSTDATLEAPTERPVGPSSGPFPAPPAPVAPEQVPVPSAGGQATGSGDPSSSSSPTSGVGVLGAQIIGKASEPKSPKNTQKLAKALKACEKKPMGKRAACEARARKLYGPSGKHVR
jgi:hypothetical protein